MHHVPLRPVDELADPPVDPPVEVVLEVREPLRELENAPSDAEDPLTLPVTEPLLLIVPVNVARVSMGDSPSLPEMVKLAPPLPFKASCPVHWTI